MMYELIMDLLTAGDLKEREKIYRKLERLGIDRTIANMMATEIYSRWEDGDAK